MTIDATIEHWKEVIQDPTFQSIREWKDRTGGKAVGYFPVYTPMELLHAGGLLPVGIMGAGNRIEIAHADARFGSFICSIVKSTMELGMCNNLRIFDAMIFHSICDTARNLAFLFKRNFSPDLYVEYIHFPQNPRSESSIDFFVTELERVIHDMEPMAANPITPESLNNSIHAYNRNRALLRQLYEIREKSPHLISTLELYVLLKAGNFLPPDEHSAILEQALVEIPLRSRKPRDKVRVVLEGSFCEQPPIELIEAFDEAGCAVVDDDLVLGRRWFTEDIPVNGDPLRALAESYVRRSTYSSVRHDWGKTRVQGLLDKVRDARAEAVVFCIAKFCEPAYFDYVLFKDALEREGIPHLLVEFEEKMWTFEKARNEIETFVESILFE
ncbi:MAG TPA: 2-hydroxyacyl-CoA dehydratase [Acidobacteriota bacterium]|nr:2-hydroxyacyl-CoA dehydratase [Acidobacteriota bacterium]